jgi:hypothetical protein
MRQVVITAITFIFLQRTQNESAIVDEERKRFGNWWLYNAGNSATMTSYLLRPFLVASEN